MFSVGQRVWHRGGHRSGTVLACDGGRVYIAQDNGAELDFPASELSATPPAVDASGGATRDFARNDVAQSGSARAGARVLANRVLTARDVTPEHVRVLGVVPVRTLQAVASIYESRPGAGKFSALDVAGKLNAIENITAVPYRVLRAYSDRPGELGLVMGKGLADSREGWVRRKLEAQGGEVGALRRCNALCGFVPLAIWGGIRAGDAARENPHQGMRATGCFSSFFPSICFGLKLPCHRGRFQSGRKCSKIILLCGGDKSGQAQDIASALKLATEI